MIDNETYDIWFLIDIVEFSNPPGYYDRYFHEDVVFDSIDGWKVCFFYDGNCLDYVSYLINPNGDIIDFWKWKTSLEKDVLYSWSYPGCSINLKNNFDLIIYNFNKREKEIAKPRNI